MNDQNEQAMTMYSYTRTYISTKLPQKNALTYSLLQNGSSHYIAPLFIELSMHIIFGSALVFEADLYSVIY